ncbi:hypothetical protein LSCM1_06757 [Leishmania martiniquensis]|uniref:Ankyrin repeat protein n=1 Tax=Leishmania martiniquensis TaxID=1580590 RepID=A0A836GVV7_9TRYP|nr:hypothetical protein LSCM1_06757 [Leishmania martiniquensis]
MHLSELCRDSDIDAIIAFLRQVAPLEPSPTPPYSEGAEDDDTIAATEPSSLHGLWSYRDNDGRTALHWTIALKNFDLACKLMQAPYSSPVLTEDEERSTPFATACSVGAPLDLLREILNRSVAEYSSYMREKEVQLHAAAEGQNSSSVVPNGPSQGRNGGKSATFLSGMLGVSDPGNTTPASISAMLFEAEDATGQTPLLLAVGRGHLDIVRFLLESGANLTHQNRRGQSPLHRAVNRGNMELVELLVSTSEKSNATNKAAHRAWMDLRDKHGDSALFYASMDNNEEIGRYLLRHGADRELRNADGKAFWEV